MGRTANTTQPTARQIAREDRKDQKRKERRQKRREWLRSTAHRQRHHGLPLAIDTSAAITGCLGHYASPTAAVISGAASAFTIGVPAALCALSDRERRFTSGHGLGSAAWSVAASVFGPFNPLVGAAGAIGAVTAQFGWVESRKVRTIRSSCKADKKHEAQWNSTTEADGHPGVLERAGLGGAALVFTETVWSADGLRRIGMNYHIDLTGSGKRSGQALSMATAFEAELGTRKGAVQLFDDENDANHVIAQVIWQKPWGPETVLVHPIERHFDEISDVVNSAIEHTVSGGTSEPIEIRDEIRGLLPNMASVRNPIYIGETPDGSAAYRRVWQKGHGAHHHLGIGKTGSGKTSDLNTEILSLLPCRDVLIWVIDVSTKRGKDFAGWGSCIDWMATDVQSATQMLKDAVNIADGRGREYRQGGNVTPGKAPTIRIVIDEFSALYKSMGDVVFSTLGRLTKEGRSQNVSVSCWSQRGTQDDFGYGFATLRSQFSQSTALQVKDAGEVGFVLSDPEVPGDPTKWGKGEGVEEDGLTGNQEHRKSCFVDQGDEEDETDLGIIPHIAALYAPFRPTLDEPSAKYASKAYHERHLNRPENPLLTPAVLAEQRKPEQIENDDELAARVNRIATNTDWLAAYMRGEFRVNTAGEFGDDAGSEEDDMLPNGSVDLATMAAEFGISTSEDAMARDARAEGAQATLTAQNTERDQQIAELDRKLSGLDGENSGLSLEDAFGKADVKAYPDTDALKQFCVRALGKAGPKGVSTGQIAKEYAAETGEKAPSTTTVVARLKDLHSNDSTARAAGQGRSVRWYRADQAPDNAQ